MNDWYKKHFEMIDTVSQTMDQFKRFEDLYGNSFHHATKGILAHEELIKSIITPFYSSYTDVITSLQPEIERMRELHITKLLKSAAFLR